MTAATHLLPPTTDRDCRECGDGLVAATTWAAMSVERRRSARAHGLARSSRVDMCARCLGRLRRAGVEVASTRGMVAGKCSRCAHVGDVAFGAGLCCDCLDVTGDLGETEAWSRMVALARPRGGAGMKRTLTEGSVRWAWFSTHERAMRAAQRQALRTAERQQVKIDTLAGAHGFIVRPTGEPLRAVAA